MIKIEKDNIDELCTKYTNGIKQIILGYIDGLRKGINGKLPFYFNNRAKSYKDYVNDHEDGIIDFLNKLEQNLKANENILNVYPQKLKEFNEKFIDLARSHKLIDTHKCKEFKYFLNTIINYRAFCDDHSKDRWDAYKLAEKLGIDVCPYCNQFYTHTVRLPQKRNVVRPQFDHYLPKSEYPLLALSFYNLVPSCPQCNHLKGDKEECIFHPYFEGIEKEISFNYDLKTNLEYHITVKTSNQLTNSKIESTLETLHLEGRYQKHTDILEEIIQKKLRYSSEHIKHLRSIFDIHDPNELYRWVFGNYYEKKDFGKRPLAKFTRDMFENTPT